jgi:hypothetical protein
MNHNSSANPVPDLYSHPIYEYLPSTFKNELSKVLSESSSLRDNPMLPLLGSSQKTGGGEKTERSEE